MTTQDDIDADWQRDNERDELIDAEESHYADNESALLDKPWERRAAEVALDLDNRLAHFRDGVA